MHSFPAKRIRSRLSSGSSSPIVVETAGGLFVAKLRGAGHGVLALVAEIIVAELAERLGLAVPERALIELSAETPSDDRNDELGDLLRASIGTNLGFRLLEGARQPRRSELYDLDDDFAVRVLWLDGLSMNPDRTLQNPNILLWKQRPWLIDHGAALSFQHRWERVSEDSPREVTAYAGHVFEERAALLPKFDSLLARLVSRAALQAAIERVPESLLAAAGIESNARRGRAAYHAFLWKRLQAPRPFVPRTAPEHD